MTLETRTLVIIPAYNEADSITAVLDAVRAEAPTCDVVVVNDGSADATPALVRAHGVPLLSLPCNLGYARALQTGLRYALERGYGTVVFFDADNQHDARDIGRLTDALAREGADLVIGSRFVDPAHRRATRHSPLGRRIGMWFFSMTTQWASGRRIYDTTSGFKALRASAARELLRVRFVDFHAELLVYMLLLGYRIHEEPIVVRERASGQSMYSLISTFTYPLQTLLLLVIAVVQARAFNGRRRSA
ncbi:MAG: glycosyltransferase family 2 protein [Chloroflexi bacterium]|nr:glycosyltransferase family 2 protein [Chloroflexota bacterium]